MKKVSFNTYRAKNRREEHNRIMSEFARFYSLPFLSLIYHLYNDLGYTQAKITDLINAHLPEGQTMTRQGLNQMMDNAGLLNK